MSGFSKFALFCAVGLSAISTNAPLWAQDQDFGKPTGYFSLGVGYSERYGETAFFTLSEENLFGSGIGAHAGAEYNRLGYRLTLDFDKEIALPFQAFGVSPLLDVSLYFDDLSWQDSSYNNRRLGLDADLLFPLRSNTLISIGYMVYSDEISDVHPDTSPLVAAEAGEQLNSGLTFGFQYDTTNTPIRPTKGVSLAFGARYAGLGGDTQKLELTANGALYQPLPYEGVLTAGFTAGNVRSLDGNAVRITDRAFLGNDLPRGFAFTGLGPRDISGATNTALGGESYAAISLATDFPISQTGSGTFYAGAFLEAGSVWNLQETAGGAMGIIDDEFHLRASFGLSLSWIGQYGEFRLSWANPYQRESYDETQPISISFTTSF